ncbi:hypothetical protein SDC9_25705 [bioreactor metagenome]|uniref:Uncharacterized protein n=1 Tax=bioreactor metagenome TaxID=1076179 RepID=A0A644ULS5_9ZZZZ
MTNSDIKTNAMTIAFIEEYEKRFNINIKKSNDIKGAKNIYEIDTNEGKAKCYLYINASTIDKEYWGFRRGIIEKLQETNFPYYLILLSINKNNYCFPRNIIQKLRNELKFSDNRKAIDYKITLPYLKDYDNYKLDWNKLNLSESISTMEEIIEIEEHYKEFLEESIFEVEYHNNNGDKDKEETIKNKCQVIADIVNSLHDNYEKKYIGTKQEHFLETVIGAAIFYIYNLNNDRWCNGKIIVSEEAKNQKKFCADHIIPRKYAASLLLKEKNLTRDKVYDYLKDIFCKVLYLTKSENASYRKKNINMDIEDIDTLFDFEVLKKMYKEQKNITLTIITKEEFEKLKKQQK